MKVLTIGFTKKPARRFFELLRESGAKRVVDVRLNNGSQLAGFAKKEDLVSWSKFARWSTFTCRGANQGIAARLQERRHRLEYL